MIKISTILLIIWGFNFKSANAQTNIDTNKLNKEYISLYEALKNPEDVYRLNLSNQTIKISDTIWSKFTNIQFLSLKNDHLKQIPKEIGYLKNLKVLDLSGNNFKILPSSFVNLNNLEELFLNDEKYLKLEKNISVLSKIPNLKTLHFDNDNLKMLPRNFYLLNQIETLDLKNNKFKKIPKEINGLNNLKQVDFHDNKFNIPAQEMQKQSFGLKIIF